MPDLPVSGRLVELEAVIEAGLPHFIAVGNALLEIRDSRLYKETHGSFGAYVVERWQFSRQAAQAYITAAETAQSVNTVLSFSEALEVARVPAGRQSEVAERVGGRGRRKARVVVEAEIKNVTPAEPEVAPEPAPAQPVTGQPTLADLLRFVGVSPERLASEATGDKAQIAGDARKVGRVAWALADLLIAEPAPSRPAVVSPFRPVLDDGVSFGHSRPAPKSAEKPTPKSRFGR